MNPKAFSVRGGDEGLKDDSPAIFSRRIYVSAAHACLLRTATVHIYTGGN